MRKRGFFRSEIDYFPFAGGGGIYGPGSTTFTSFTCNLSTVNGTAFITNPSVNLTRYLGYKITITAGGKTLVGWIKAAGSGETYGSTVIVNGGFTNWTGDNPNNWELLGIEDVNNYIKEDSGKANLVSNGTIIGILQNVWTVGILYKNSVAISAITGSVSLGREANIGTTIANYTTTGTKTSYVTANAQAIGIKRTVSSSCNATFDDFSSVPVLTPSATGVTIVSSQGGSTYNWLSNDGLDANSASYTLTISAR